MSRVNRTHPGEIIKNDCLEPLGLSVTDAAKALGRWWGRSLVAAALMVCPGPAVAAEWFVRAGAAGQGSRSAPFGRIQSAAVALRPTLFAYQFIYELTPMTRPSEHREVIRDPDGEIDLVARADRSGQIAPV